jgi:hypothetical protein
MDLSLDPSGTGHHADETEDPSLEAIAAGRRTKGLPLGKECGKALVRCQSGEGGADEAGTHS